MSVKEYRPLPSGNERYSVKGRQQLGLRQRHGEMFLNHAGGAASAVAGHRPYPFGGHRLFGSRRCETCSVALSKSFDPSIRNVVGQDDLQRPVVLDLTVDLEG